MSSKKPPKKRPARPTPNTRIARALQRAIFHAGSQNKLALAIRRTRAYRTTKVSGSHVCYWLKRGWVPHYIAGPIETATQGAVQRWELDPRTFPAPRVAA